MIVDQAKAGKESIVSEVKAMIISNDPKNYYKSKYPKNYMLLRYEELDKDPVGMGKKLLLFTGLQETDQLKAWLEYEMRERNEVANSEMKLRSENWWSDLSAKDLQVINTECDEYITIAGYNQHPNASTTTR